MPRRKQVEKEVIRHKNLSIGQIDAQNWYVATVKGSALTDHHYFGSLPKAAVGAAHLLIGGLKGQKDDLVGLAARWEREAKRLEGAITNALKIYDTSRNACHALPAIDGVEIKKSDLPRKAA